VVKASDGRRPRAWLEQPTLLINAYQNQLELPVLFTC
jgi:hypothetical protein